MSAPGAIVVSNCLLHHGLTSHEIAVYLSIKHHDWGADWDMTFSQIAVEAGCSRSSVRRALASLIKIEAIQQRRTTKHEAGVYKALDPPICSTCQARMLTGSTL